MEILFDSFGWGAPDPVESLLARADFPFQGGLLVSHRAQLFEDFGAIGAGVVELSLEGPGPVLEIFVAAEGVLIGSLFGFASATGSLELHPEAGFFSQEACEPAAPHDLVGVGVLIGAGADFEVFDEKCEFGDGAVCQDQGSFCGFEVSQGEKAFEGDDIAGL